jgi:hypothetical protein
MPNHPLPTAGAAVFGHDKSKNDSKNENKSKATAHARELAAAGDYVLGALADDEKRTEGALDQLDVVKLPALILDIACRAVAALAVERGIGADDAMAMLVSGQ